MSTQSINKQWQSFLHYLLLICICLPLFTGCESSRVIVNGIPDERDANEILVFLSSKGISATKQASAAAKGGGTKQVLWDISVNNSEALDAMSYLNQAGLPRKRSQSLLNIFTGAGLVPSEMEQKIRYQAGLAEQIASTLRKMDGVLDAEVQISFPQEDPLNPTKKKTPITASVFIKHNGILENPNSHLQTKIKRLVAASVPNLDFNNVTVVGERARYNDLMPDFGMSSDDGILYSTVWGLIIAKDSLWRFQIIFFSFTIVLLLTSVLLVWMFWKTYPLLKSHGGIKEIFHFKPFPTERKEAPKENPKETSKEAPKEPSLEKPDEKVKEEEKPKNDAETKT